ncbi:DHHA1 domain-containing protein [Tepidibacillus marianensis]|uniref:alanyl-tRNA editing protein n=1 Tax=Tepidibacillus marianensis TaxID=3131995 RepID=UPI0030D4A579
MGTLSGISVQDVYKKNGVIYHVLFSSLHGEEEVNGLIDWERRFDHMQQHSGQHILSRAFEILYDIETIGFHLGEEIVTIDLNTSQLTDEMVEKVERLSNQIVMGNRAIHKQLLSPDQMAEQAIAKIPELDGYVRLVEIENFDSCPCAGTHPDYTGEIGLIKILGTEKVRKNIRLTFVCGFRALQFFTKFKQELTNTASLLKTNWENVKEKTKFLLAEINLFEGQTKSLKQELLPYHIEKWRQKAIQIGEVYLVEAVVDDREIQELRQLSQEIVESPSYIVLFTIKSNEKVQFFLQRSENMTISMNDVLKIGLEIVHGKGGGTPKMAQGGSTDIHQLDEALTRMKEYLTRQLKG